MTARSTVLADYTITWSSIPLEQYWALPEQAQKQVDERLRAVRRDPLSPPEDYSPDTDLWTVAYGGGAGLLVYAAVPVRQRVIILRLVHLDDA